MFNKKGTTVTKSFARLYWSRQVFGKPSMARKISKRSRFHFRKITPIPKLLSFVLLLCSIWNGFLSSLPHFSPLHGTFLTECRAIFALSSSFYSCLFPSTYLSLSSLFYRVYRHNGFGSALTVPMHVCTIGRNSLKLHFALTCKSSHRYSSNRYPKSCMSPCVQSSEGSRSLSLSLSLSHVTARAS